MQSWFWPGSALRQDVKLPYRNTSSILRETIEFHCACLFGSAEKTIVIDFIARFPIDGAIAKNIDLSPGRRFDPDQQ
jgi:hypothetical protein